MRRSLTLRIVGVFAAVMAAIGVLVGPAVATTAPGCGVTWGSLDKQSGHGPGFSGASLLAVRAGQHSCYDRLVFELQGPAAGYRVRYGPVVTQGEGKPIRLRGGASLGITLYAPAHDINGVPTYNPRDRANVVDVRSFRTLRQVAFGGSFEGYTTFGLGLRARLPFRVFILAGRVTLADRHGRRPRLVTHSDSGGRARRGDRGRGLLGSTTTAGSTSWSPGPGLA
jgi:hypothetical protein